MRHLEVSVELLNNYDGIIKHSNNRHKKSFQYS